MAVTDSPQGKVKRVFEGDVVYSGSVFGVWQTINGDALVAQAAADLLNPKEADDSGVRWISVPAGCASILIRAKCNQSATAVTASTPVVRVYGGYGTMLNQVPEAFLRLDAAGPTTAGVVLAFDATPVDTDSFNDNTNWLSQLLSLSATSLQGAEYVAVLIETVIAGTGITSASVECMFLN